MERLVLRALGWFGTLVLATCLALFVTILVSIIIWPGEAKLVAPLLCSGDRAMVDVTREFGAGSGGPLDYSLTCTSSSGEVSDEGALRPLLTLGAIHTVLCLPIVMLSDRRSWGHGTSDPVFDQQHLHAHDHHHHHHHID